MDMANDFLDELQAGFLEEAQELLNQVENNFLDLEKNENKQEILEEIFRIVHNIKGSAGAVSFDNLSNLAHHVENLLVKLKNGEINPTPEVIDLLLLSNDELCTAISKLHEDRAFAGDYTSLFSQIDVVLSGGVPASAEEVEPETVIDLSDPEPEPEVKEELVAKVESSKPKTIGEILVEEKMVSDAQLDHALDLQNKKVGEILVDQGDIKEEQLEQALEKQAAQAPAKKSSKKPDEHIRLPLSKIENLLDNFGEQVILQSTLDHYRQDVVENADAINRTILQLNKITYDLQQTAIALRMLSLRGLFNKMQRIVRDGAKTLGKEIEFHTEGEDTELDKTIMDELSSPLTHLIRNSVDHGIEDADLRKERGKSAAGNVWMSASYRGRYFFLEIRDDGGGLNKDRILQKAIQKGLIKENQQLSDSEIYDLVFQNGFSTKDEATDLSGRGVGMDAIKKVIEKLRGSIEMRSEEGKGTTITIKLPPTLAMFNGMVVVIGSQKYIIPNSELTKIFKVNLEDIQQLSPKEDIVKIGEQVFQIVDIAKVIKCESQATNKKTLLEFRYEGKTYGVLVDEILSIQRIVYKNLGDEVSGIPGVAGGTILGDGHVAMILDLADLVDLYKGTRH